MPGEADKIMFEVYRAGGLDPRYRVVYFTELDESRRDAAIDAALSGEPFFDGFLDQRRAEAGKAVLSAFTRRLNDGDPATREELERLLAPFLAG